MENINEEVLIEIKPKFKLIYEIFMPTGKKIKKSLFFVVISLICTILVFLYGDSLGTLKINLLGSISLISIIKWILLFMLIIAIIILIFNIVIQKLQYNHISYKFYKTHMVYEDDFLNQHKKNVDYNNIKEIEIRRTVLDRILGFGVIIIYTNAENKRSNGLVVYGIEDPKGVYDKINKIVNLSGKSQNVNGDSNINE